MNTYDIQRLGHHGDGVAEGPIFAPMTLPGERVSGVLNGQRLENVKIIEPSVDRVAAPCRHFKSCGGCAVQHAGDDYVAAWKRGIVETALQAQGIEAQFAGVVTSPAQSRRRATLSARRTKGGAIAGFHGRASGAIVDVVDCKLLHPDLMRALPVAEALAIAGSGRKGEIAVLATLSEGGLDVAVSGGKPLDEALRLKLSEAAQHLDLARLAWDGEVVVTRQLPVQRFGRAQVVPPPGAFLQATAHGEATLRDAVMGITRGAKTVADLFAGCGTFALPLSEQAEVLAVEGDRDMTDALEQGWRRAGGLHRLRPMVRDLFRNPLTPEDLKGIEAVVIDPPRAGAEAQTRQLAEAHIPVIAAVSCNPMTFARDARLLIEAGYRMGPVQVVDQFRWSAHVELVTEFSLN
ncbi:class I SAM-dependent RNA methyltransferase [Pseudooceanicola sediminis]|uniref:Class I SAM-dependent RNA methyltransferase n=1 Tax=Pseudooceanicola sediminis TaxID=2211117 RepID=A0A399J827_9RHOB|nr:class I SAM-dependent RNA methyltransferase [Pseudooceanicola sediminis]KAA2315425.1 class I SAM-dependent RNA methyltransferase [Puniceibacterium sp. HSS470]RII40369.1 class I SAM-dependent RNA methyltransferase [Pseudooceanicola sediminis]|tara:strand:+ start:66993 stop:68210 length:1218 start_codon:yes stop_codon:yes gene_type:complete